LWAKGRNHQPSIVFGDADLLIAATASFHGRKLVTMDARLAENLRRIGVDDLQLIPQ
jgi:predicted nucleic acid-binding protein